MDLCDLHCDTAYELWRRGENLRRASLDITLQMIGSYRKYVQLAAFCAPSDMSDDDAYDCALSVYDTFIREVESCGGAVCRTAAELRAAAASGIPSFVLTLEDARVACGDHARLRHLFDTGVRVVTPLWGGETVIGGSHESESGLTPVGRELAEECAELGIVTDISHASVRSADDMLDIAARHGMPVIASHSCAYSVTPHSRNICDRHIRAVVQSGGIIGVNLYPPHLTGGDTATAEDVARHIMYISDLAGDGAAALGCDFDGMDHHTAGLENLACLGMLADQLARDGINDEIAHKIFYENAFNFLVNHL